GVFTAQDLAAAGVSGSLWSVQARDRRGATGAAPHRPILAGDRVRFAGEALALVVAESRAAAQDAAEAIGLEIDDLPAVTALDPAAPFHDGLADTQAFDWHL